MTLALIVAIGFLAGWLGTRAIEHYALRAGVIDVPGERSSHVRPTPRGGGLSIVLFTLTLTVWLWQRSSIESDLALSILLGGGAVALTGWIDDRRGLAWSTRLVVQLAAALLALRLLGGWPRIDLGTGLALTLGIFGYLFGTLFIVWLTNLYNFMDGIDGIAGVEAVTTAGFAAALIYSAAPAGWPLLLAGMAAVGAGFLTCNWPPARIFMGDVASGFLGYVFAVFAIAADRKGMAPVTVWLILLAVFLVDATLTVVRRMANRERFVAAHRKHAYQRAARKFGSHVTVTVAVLLINLGLGTALLLLDQRRIGLAAAFAATVVIASYLFIERQAPMSGDR